MLRLHEYQCLIFDCDGVVLNSNKIKTDAFYNVAKSYGHIAAEQLRQYHIKNGGISRYKKIEYFFKSILKKNASGNEIRKLVREFSDDVKLALQSCEVASGLKELRNKTSHTKWLVVSGSDEVELKEIFAYLNIDMLFDGGIFGSPDDKETILDREIENKNISEPSLFLGDSKYDYFASKTVGLDFLFISGWSEVEGWEEWANYNEITTVNVLNDLCDASF